MKSGGNKNFPSELELFNRNNALDARDGSRLGSIGKRSAPLAASSAASCGEDAVRDELMELKGCGEGVERKAEKENNWKVAHDHLRN
jgi:hypothetical protein